MGVFESSWANFHVDPLSLATKSSQVLERNVSLLPQDRIDLLNNLSSANELPAVGKLKIIGANKADAI